MIPTETDKAYAAGMLDADGSIGLYKYAGGSISRFVSVASQHTDVLEWLRVRFGGKVYSSKGCSIWQPLAGRRAFIEAVLPYLQIKKQQAELLLETYDRKLTPEDVAEYMARSKELNGRLPKLFKVEPKISSQEETSG